MTRFAAETGTALALARKENIRLDMEGVARLASKNLLPDPALSEFLPDGTMRYWPKLEAPPVATGRNVYVREPGGLFDRFTAQNNSPLPRDRAGYAQRLALVNGQPLPGAKSPYGLDPASAPFLYPVNLPNSGYSAGAYKRSYAWAVRIRGGGPQGWLLTGPAPLTSFNVAEDQSTEQPLPKEVPEGVDGIAILDSLPGDGRTPPPLFVQRVIDVRDYTPQTYTMDGPPRYSWMAPLTNQTYVGGLGRWGGLRVVRRPYHLDLQWTDALLSWKFRTARGWSASQGTTHVEHRYLERHTRFLAEPYSMPPSAEAWVFQIQGPDGQWYDAAYGTAGEELGRGEQAWYVVDDPEKVDEINDDRGPAGGGAQVGMRMESGERSKKDETGVPGPDEALEAPLTFGKARIGPGRKVVRVTDIYTSQDGSGYEGPPSPPNTIALGNQQGFLVDFREFADEGDVIPNGDYEEQVVAPGGFRVPRGFSYVGAPSVSLKMSAQESVVEFDDATGRTTNELVFQSGVFKIAPVPYTIRAGVRLGRASGGNARVVFRFYETRQSTPTTVRLVAQQGTVGRSLGSFTCGPVGSGCDLEYPANTAYADYYCDIRGDVGARNLAGSFIHIGMFRGKAAPRKAEDVPNPVPEAEPENQPYPPGSYMRVVENPSWSGGKGNGFEYYGSEPALLRRRRFASGLRLPVDANSVYCFQADYYHEGLEVGSEVMPVSVLNSKGEATDNQRNGMTGGPLLTASEAADGSRTQGQTFITLETGPDAAYIEVGDSTLGSGLLRMWGLQLSYGTLPVPWTNDVAPSGVIAAEFDTRTPRVDNALETVFAYKRLFSGGVVADLPVGTSAPVRYRGRDSKADPLSVYYDDITLMPRFRFVEVEATPQTTTPASGESPEISSLFAEAEPPRTVLLRPDGSEYPGGVLVEGMPATQYAENTEESMRSDGYPRYRQLYPSWPDFEGVTIKAYSEEAVEAISYDATHGRRLFVIEGWGKSRMVRITSIRFGVNRMERVMGRNVYVHEASDVSGKIVQETPLEASPEGAI